MGRLVRSSPDLCSAEVMMQMIAKDYAERFNACGPPKKVVGEPRWTQGDLYGPQRNPRERGLLAWLRLGSVQRLIIQGMEMKRITWVGLFPYSRCVGGTLLDSSWATWTQKDRWGPASMATTYGNQPGWCAGWPRNVCTSHGKGKFSYKLTSYLGLH